MIKLEVYLKTRTNPTQTLPSYTSLGAYPLVYRAEDGAWFCGECANSEEAKTIDDPQWNIETVEVYYEGPTVLCADCENMIESAYGGP